MPALKMVCIYIYIYIQWKLATFNSHASRKLENWLDYIKVDEDNILEDVIFPKKCCNGQHNRCVNIWTRRIHMETQFLACKYRLAKDLGESKWIETGVCQHFFFVNDGWIIISHPCLVTKEAEKQNCCLSLKLLLHLCMLTSV